MSNQDFQEALEQNDIDLLAKIPKSDLHNHAALGSRIEFLEKWAKQKIIRPPQEMKKFSDFEDYLEKAFNKFVQAPVFLSTQKRPPLNRPATMVLRCFKLASTRVFLVVQTKIAGKKLILFKALSGGYLPGYILYRSLVFNEIRTRKNFFMMPRDFLTQAISGQ